MARHSTRPSRRPFPRSPRRSPTTVPAVVAMLLWAAVGILVYQFVSHVYWAWLAGGTVATALLFAFDKTQSKGTGRRVPEAVLLALVLLGGVIGGWFGMLILRHKTRHNSFWIVQWLASVLHGGIAWWVWTSGT